MPRAGALLLAIAAVLLAAEWVHASYIDPGTDGTQASSLGNGPNAVLGSKHDIKLKKERGDDDVEVNLSDYGEDPADLQLLQDVGKRSSLIYVFRRACVKRGGNCDHRPGDCCHSSSCRCNLWGSNCRCQRMGLFQKWG